MSPCQDCHAGCCRSFAIAVTGADILRIERDTTLKFWDFACRWEDREGTIAQNYAPQFHFQDEPETPFVICLKQTQSDYLTDIPKCLFLKEEAPCQEAPLGRASCGNYENRPAACRVFPTKFSNSGDLPIIYDVPARGREDSTHPAFSLCPRPWQSTDLDSLQVMQDLAVAQVEMNFFKSIATLWNRNPGEWEVFPEFLRIVYENRLTCERDAVQPSASQPATLQSSEATQTETDARIFKLPNSDQRKDAA